MSSKKINAVGFYLLVQGSTRIGERIVLWLTILHDLSPRRAAPRSCGWGQPLSRSGGNVTERHVRITWACLYIPYIVE